MHTQHFSVRSTLKEWVKRRSNMFYHRSVTSVSTYLDKLGKEGMQSKNWLLHAFHSNYIHFTVNDLVSNSVQRSINCGKNVQS